MFITFYKGDKGSGFWCQGQLNGTDLITIRPKGRDKWIQIIDGGNGIEIKEYPNHEFKDSGDLSHIED